MSELYRHIIDQLLEREALSLTADQEDATLAFLDYHTTGPDRGAFVMRGAAGTGKTFMIRLLTRFLLRQGFKVVLLAPTGRAAKVITRRTKRYAATIHRHVYAPIESPTGSIVFMLKENRDPRKTVYIVDEASMIGDGPDAGGTGLLADFLKFAYHEYSDRRVIFVGDPAQLPPVGSSRSPALEPEYLHKEFGVQIWAADMKKVMRQADTSDILLWANEVRHQMEEGGRPVFEPSYGSDVEVVDQAYEALELYTGLYRSDDPDQVLFMTYSNRMAVEVNKAIRHQMFEAEEPLVPGEVLMVVRNNYAWGTDELPFLANGEMGIVRDVHRETYEERYGLKWMDVDIEFINVSEKSVLISCKLLLDLLDDKQAQVNYQTMRKVLLERGREYDHLPKSRRAEGVRKDPYINALQVKYGYAVTGHKAQGGQWKNVIVAFEPLYEGMTMADYLRWTYTAMTRAEERLYLLNFPFVQREF